MSTIITLDEAESKLREIISQLGPDDEVVIMDNQQPVARLVGKPSPARQRPQPGLCRGMLTIVSDDEEHLADFQEYMP